MQYIKNEWIKIWSQKNAWIMLIILLALLSIVIGVDKYFTDDSSTKEARLEANEAQLEKYNDWLAEEGNTEEDIQQYNDEIKAIQYRIDNDLPSQNSTSFSSEMYGSLSISLALVTIFGIAIAAGIVSSEFNSGTIKMLLTRPVARWKILLSKLVATILFSLSLLIVSMAFAAILNAILFSTGNAIDVYSVNGEIMTEEVEYKYFEYILYSLASLLMTIIFAFMFGSLFSSSTLAVTVSLFIYLMGNVATMFIAKYSFAKYIWFTNDFSYYVPDSMPLIEDLTITFSTIVNIVYAIIFLAITFITFNKRDITA